LKPKNDPNLFPKSKVYVELSEIVFENHILAVKGFIMSVKA
jgi:hypothetical protein